MTRFIRPDRLFMGVLICFASLTCAAELPNPLLIEDAIRLAQQRDPWITGNKLQQSALQSKSIAAATLDDPRVSLSYMGLPTDTWDRDQENMTQLQLGISQMFPRGDSNQIQQQQLARQASTYPILREERNAQVALTVTQLWLDIFLAHATVEQINEKKVLFEQLIDIAVASYSNTSGNTQQQDVVRAQLELVQLDDRLAMEIQKLEEAKAALLQWIQVGAASQDQYQLDFGSSKLFDALEALTLPSSLPDLVLEQAELLESQTTSLEHLASIVSQHPSIAAIDSRYRASQSAVQLAKQKYQPQWGVNASYGFRQDAPSGMERADLFSIGVSFDLPIFTENKQDKEVQASLAESESLLTEKMLKLKSMLAEILKAYRQLQKLDQRQHLYQDQLLVQTHEQSEAALTAYTNDKGDFTEVVRARIVELQTHIAALQIDVQRLKTIAQINYFFTTASNTGDNINEY